MTTNQNVLINVEQEDRQEAIFMSSSFVNPAVKNRAYLNALGAELIGRYLKTEGIEISETRNVHSMSKVLEKTDISDILLENIHIDIRVIFDENQIFIPKSHFDLEILPDVYAVVKFDSDYSSANFLGYVLPSQVDKTKQNNEYYFVESSQLSSPESFSSFVKEFVGKTQKELSEEDYLKGRELSVSLADHSITESDYREFLELVFANSALREEVLEFDNFETLSYNTAPLLVQDVEDNSGAVIEDEKDISIGTIDEIQEDNDVAQIVSEDETSVENLDLDENLILDDNLGDEDLLLNIDSEKEELNQEENLQEEIQTEVQAVSEDDSVEESVVNNEVKVSSSENILPIKDVQTLSVDDILDATIASIDTGVAATSLAEGIGVAGAAGAAGIVAGAAIAGSVVEDAVKSIVPDKIEGEISTEEKVGVSENQEADKNLNDELASDEAIKLAGVSGEVVDSKVEEKVEKQHKNLDKIDYKKTDIYSEMPEENKDVEEITRLSSAKLEKNKDNEDSGLYDEPKDLAELNVVEQKTEDEYIQETSSFEDMDMVDSENYPQEMLEDFEMADLSDVDLSADIGDLPLNPESEDVELVDMDISGGYAINEDGTSNFDNLGSDIFEDKEEDNFVNFDMGKISFDDEKEEDFSDISINESLDENMMVKTEEEPAEISEQEIQLSNSLDEAVTDEFLSVDDLELLSDEKSENEEEIVDVDDFFAEDVEEKNEDEHDEKLEEEKDFADFENDVSMPDEENTDVEALSTVDESIQSTGDEVSLEDSPELEKNTESSEDEWLNTDFSELSGHENAESEEEIIIDEDENGKVYSVVENSRVISDKNFEVGEIPFDINMEESSSEDGNIEELYSQSEEASSSLLQNSGRVPTSADVNKKLPFGLAIAGVLISLAFIGAIGFGVSKMLKPSNNEEPQPLTDEPLSSSDNGVKTSDTLNVNPENVVNMDEASLSQANDVKPVAATATSVKPAVQSSTPVGKATPTSFIQVRKLTWEVPDYVSYDSQFKQYFQSVGRSLKSALSSDLLLATDLVYANSARVSIGFDKDGTFKSAVIVNSSGSAQIDKILLQTVNQTLGSLKAPHSVGNDENTTAILKIYF